MSYIVTAPLIIAKKEDGADLYLYTNAPVPEHVSAEALARYEALGMVEKVDGRASKSTAKAPTSESN